jgi:long-chain acyl-CoA synthetase
MAAELPEHPGRVVARLARQVELAAATVELTLSQYRVLGILGDGREATSVLADKLAVSRPSVTGVIDGLVARGLVRRDPDKTDRRRIDLALTDDGHQVLAGADAEVERRLIEIAGHAGSGTDDPFAGLGPWRAALDAYRTARHAGRLAASAG